MGKNVTEVVRTVCRELRWREVGGPGHPFAGVDVPTVGVRTAVLVAQDAAVPPTFEKSAGVDAVLPRAVAIKVICALPGQNCSEMRRLHRGHKPLPRGVIRNTEQPDFPAAPWLRARPFNGIVKVAKLRRRIRIESTRRLAGAAGVHVDNHVAVRDPHLRVRPLEDEVLARRSCQNLRIGRVQSVPSLLHEFPQRHVLSVRPSVINTGNRPSAWGRYTFARKIAPSRIGTSAFCSTSISCRLVMAQSLPYGDIAPSRKSS